MVSLILLITDSMYTVGYFLTIIDYSIQQSTALRTKAFILAKAPEALLSSATGVEVELFSF
ncbi:MAG: hypothetical protein E7018_01335 [Alphaproteobacteria bacterium]|nr:hypothetical protein [Alphaproteobacteria bacterium]